MIEIELGLTSIAIRIREVCVLCAEEVSFCRAFADIREAVISWHRGWTYQC